MQKEGFPVTNGKYDISGPIPFKVGLYNLNRQPNLNYELGRMINWSGGDLHEVEKVSRSIRSFSDWKRVLAGLGDRALKEGRTGNAIAYYRMAEFYMDWTDPDAMKYYRKAKELFYDYYAGYFEAPQGGSPVVERFEVPYEDTSLPVMRAEADGVRKGTVLLHGGYDSYMEEFLFPMLYFREKGYSVYLFEGPGQGVMLRERAKPVNPRWEQAVKALLDYFALEDVCIIGISLGGYYAPRAAAFDGRISRVVEWSAFPSFIDNVGVSCGYWAVRLLKRMAYGHSGELFLSFMKKLALRGNMKASVLTDAMHKLGAGSFRELYEAAAALDIRPAADRITQDVLILHGEKDILCDVRMVKIAAALQKNARSVTTRIFRCKEEQAGDHCQCGNTKLALDTIIGWLDSFCP